MDLNIAALRQKLSDRKAELTARYMARREALLEACKMGGKQEEPNQSSSGWHAPHDGWVSPETDEVYGKGQWVPLPRDEWYCSTPDEPYPVKTYRVLVGDDKREEISEILRQFATISEGRSFQSANDGWVRYLYLSGYEPLIKVVEAHVAEEGERIRAEARARKGVAPVGRVEVEGVVRRVKKEQGYYGETFKMLVELDNLSTVWGTLPSALAFPEGIEGKRVFFTATFEHAKDDNTHAFFTRPAKAALMTEEGEE